MGYFVVEVSTLALFAGFVALTQYEQRRGARFLNVIRKGIDRFAARLEFIFTHVDFLAFIRESVRQAFDKIAHDSAHMALQVTRLLEQQLTRAVRYFRARFAARAALTPSSPKESSEFVRAIADYKQELRENRSEENKITEQ